MRAGLSDIEWLRQADSLTVGAGGGPRGDETRPEALAARLVVLARALVSVGGDACACADGTCARCLLVSAAGGNRAWSLAEHLAAADRRPVLGRPPDDRGAAVGLAARYRATLRVAVPAVCLCRRVQHPGGRCWFSPLGPADGLCGEVLEVSHLVCVA